MSLRNIRSYERAELELPHGTTLISGDVGAGKTSILYAVEMALFGFSAVDAPLLIRHGAVHAEVSVTLEGTGHRYEVGRTFRRATRKGRDTFEVERLTFTADGARTVYSATELRQRIIDLFGFPDNPNPRSHSDLWRWAVYVPQERMREVLAQEAQERLETVRRALGVERYRRAADNAQEVASEIRQLVRMRREQSDQLRHWESELLDRTEELERAEVRLADLAEGVRSAETEAATRRAEVEGAEGMVRQAEGDRRELEGLRREQQRELEQFAALERKLAEAERFLATQPAGDPERLRALDEGLEQVLSERDRLAAQRGEAERVLREGEAKVRELIQAQTDLEGIERLLLDRERERTQADQELSQAQAELGRGEAEGPVHEPPAPTPHTVPEIEHALAAARGVERETREREVRARSDVEEIEHLLDAGECPRCHQKVRAADFESHRAEALRSLDRAHEEGDAAGREVARLDEERRSRERFERARDRWLEIERRRGAVRERVDRAARRVAQARESHAQATAARSRLEARRAALAPARQVEEQARADQQRQDQALRALEDRIEAQRRERDELVTATHRREQLVLERRRLLEDSGSLKGRMAEREGRLTGLGGRAGRLPELSAGLASARNAETAANGRLEALRVESARVDQNASNARRRRKEAQEGVAERGHLLREAEDLTRKAAWLGGAYRESLLRMEQRILSQAQATFQRDFHRFFRGLIDDPLLEARVGASFEPTVLIEGEWTPAEALSGGERTALALAFRLALGRVVRTMGSLKLDTLVLDEPTDGFSPEQIVRMGELLRRLELPQVILVSHETQLSAVADHVLEVAKTKGRSELRRAGAPARSPSVAPPSEPGATHRPPRPRRSRSGRSKGP